MGIFPLARVALASPRRRVGFLAVNVVAAEKGVVVSKTLGIILIVLGLFGLA